MRVITCERPIESTSYTPLRARVVPGLRRISGYGEDVADAVGVGSEEHGLEPRDGRVAWCEVRNRLEAGDPLDRGRRDEPVHPRARPWVVVDVDDVHVSRVLERAGELEHRLGVAASRRVDLDRHDELALPELSLEECLVLGLGRGDCDLSSAYDELRARAAVLVDGVPDRGDLGRRRPAAAADDARSELACMSGELLEVLGRCVREDHALSREAREADIRKRCERLPALGHPLECPERGLQPEAVVGTDRGDVDIRQRPRCLLRRHAAERVGVLVEGEQAYDRQCRDASNRADGGEELVEVEEGLDHEQVDAATLEQLCLLGEDRVAVLRRTTQRADGAGDEHVRPGHLPRVPCDLHGSLVDRGDLVLEVVLRELAAVCAERVRLDEVRAGTDEAEVQREDALRCAEVRLLGAAQPRYRARDERAHPAVADEGCPARESFEEPAHRAASLLRAVNQPCQRTPGDRSSAFRGSPAVGESTRVRSLTTGSDAAATRVRSLRGEEAVPPTEELAGGGERGLGGYPAPFPSQASVSAVPIASATPGWD